MVGASSSLVDGFTGPQAIPTPRVVTPRPVTAVAARADPAVDRAVLPARQWPRPYAMAEQIPAYQAGLQKDGAGEVADVSVVGDEAEVSTRLRRFADIVAPSS